MNRRAVNTEELASSIHKIMSDAPPIEDPELDYLAVDGSTAKMKDFERYILSKIAKPLFCGFKEDDSINNVSVACMYLLKMIKGRKY